ncbi:endolytic transglycosylase MltG [Qingshengfaniella alkalisoli]|uniref:Endolytic murein transglycosylase n=1 Tax=Qingshengfaniella alkalisoli TaxID=2599296 RepID=A0A5B8I670_9RHOB|nr:endolytic transglycosylase MltG [Qingshengfaniella alkalisoli]QDY68915.1 endolytic transglycosylase MltG [Qingshengfaniella alkalisoli]
MWRAIASNALSVLIVALIGLGIVIAMGQNAYKSPGPLAEAICVGVPRGSTMKVISDRLDEQGAVTSGAIMRIGADYTERSAGLKAGNFLVPEGASMEEIVDIITSTGQSTCGSEINLRVGVAETIIHVREFDPARSEYIDYANFAAGEEPPVEYEQVANDGFARFRVTLVPGATSWAVAEGLKNAPFLSGEVEGVPAEGSLAPGSYEISQGTDRASIIDQMEQRQATVLAEAWGQRIEDLPLETPEEVLIMASIIEKETAVADERRLVASVFENRLKRGMRLQTDPTVIYGVTGGQGVLGRGLLRSELDQVTPYNTYQIDGLPPTPIANPGRASIEAAVNPERTEFVYFVADGTGGHAFAQTLDEHNANVAKWRAIEAERAEQ